MLTPAGLEWHDPKTGKLKGKIQKLAGYTVSIERDSKYECCFSLTHDNKKRRNLYLRGETNEEREAWINALDAAVAIADSFKAGLDAEVSDGGDMPYNSADEEEENTSI